jgi:hypothetical protein
MLVQYLQQRWADLASTASDIHSRRMKSQRLDLKLELIDFMSIQLICAYQPIDFDCPLSRSWMRRLGLTPLWRNSLFESSRQGIVEGGARDSSNSMGGFWLIQGAVEQHCEQHIAASTGKSVST